MRIEYIQLNDPAHRQYCQRAEVVLNFLGQEVLGEPFYPFPEDSVPLLYGAVDDGRLVAAATLIESRRGEGQFLLGLMGVAADRRGQGLGNELLRRVEGQALELGAVAIAVIPLVSYDVQSGKDARYFYRRRGFIEQPDQGPELLVKVLRTSA